MPPAEDFFSLTTSVCSWTNFDPAVKADLSSTAIKTSAGIYIIDPIPLRPEALDEMIGDAQIAGIIQTNANHERASNEFAQKFSAEIFQPRNEQDFAGGLSAISVPGAAENEIALHFADDGGTIIVGDTLINFGANGFDFLPRKYCADQKLMKRSLRKLLDVEFTRLLFAHGQPIAANARAKLEQLLDRAER